VQKEKKERSGRYEDKILIHSRREERKSHTPGGQRMEKISREWGREQKHLKGGNKSLTLKKKVPLGQSGKNAVVARERKTSINHQKVKTGYPS